MAIRLEKGQKINLEKSNRTELTNFCVGCNWGCIEKVTSGFLGIFNKKVKVDVDLDLSCIMIDSKGNLCDHIYSPYYKVAFLKSYNLPPGKLDSLDMALHHSGDDLAGDQDEDDGLDNEIISVDLKKVNMDVQQIFFFLNNVNQEDFYQIPYASIRMYEGTPKSVKSIFAQYDVVAAPEYKDKRSLIMGKLYRYNNAWRFAAIGDAYDDANLCETIIRIIRYYAR